MTDLTFVAPLFVPGDRSERYAKAAASGADAVILDLEDAVAPAAKAQARAALQTGFTDLPVVVRINAVGTPWHDADLAAVAQLPVAAIMLPKAERADDLARVAAVMPVIALIETVAGVAAVRELALSGQAARLAFGSIDYAADLGCDHVREALAHARSEIVFASRLGGLVAPLDGVTTDVQDPERALDDAHYSAALGFGGKLAIHPRQVAGIRQAFRPSEAQIDWARRVLETGAGAATVDGSMVDEPVRIRARSILSKAQRDF